MSADPRGVETGAGHTVAGGPERGAGPAEDASLTDLLSRLGDDLTLLFRQEVELAKAEIKRDVSEAGKAAGLLAAGALVAFVTLLLLAWAASWGLAEVLPTGVAFLIVGVVFGIAAAVLVVVGKKRMDAVDLTPRATIETLQQDKEVLTDRRTP